LTFAAEGRSFLAFDKQFQRGGIMTNTPEISLDPDDWATHRALAHQIVDDAVDHLEGVRNRPVWQPMPQDVRATYLAPVPDQPTPLADVYAQMQENLLPYPMGGIHPMFFGWYMGASNFTGALADFIAAIDGSNLGGGDTAAVATDAQAVRWLRGMMGFPDTASGTLTSGGSMANMVGLTVARNVMAGVDVRVEGVTNLPQPLRFYASDQVHSAHQKAMEGLGLGSRSLRLVPSDDALRMDVAALTRMIAEDRGAGLRPACVIATAGTTNTGSIDDLVAIGALCRREGLWFHVDGCIGALIRIAPENRHLVAGVEVADSLALDPHKWLQTPFECGCVLVRDAKQHRQAFTLHGDYLQNQTRGIAGAEFLADYGYELSRGFKALKLWMSLKEQGVAKFGALIDQHIAMGHYLTNAVKAEPELELISPAVINIVCFRYVGRGGSEAELKALNTEIMLRVQESGVAVLTDTTLKGRHSLRAAIVNHRSTRADIDMAIREVLRWGEQLQG
jgi:aromatic-L-amino-acid/L-tryptophan decarboxylase